MGMTFESWVKQYLGKKTDYDKMYGVQCVDLIDCYIDKCLGLKKGFWGNAKNWWTDRSKSAWLKNNFEFITPKYKNGELKQGDIGIRTSGKCGHIFIIAEPAANGNFKCYDQNATGNGDAMTLRTKAFTSANINGVLRPKNQTPFKTTATSTFTKPSTTTTTSGFPSAVTWKNGSTVETVYKQDNLKEKVGTIFAKATAKCYAKSNLGWLVVYDLDGTTKHKAGFVKYGGGLKSAPIQYKIWKNGQTLETVYADTARKTKIGSIFAYGSARCYGKIDNMYLVRYQIDGTSTYKVGFVAYSGGC